MNTIKHFCRRMPLIKQILAEREKFYSELSAIEEKLSGLAGPKDNKLFFPPGHYYSPIPAPDYIARHETKIFGIAPRKILGIDLREDEQMKLLESLKPYYDELPFRSEKVSNLRYFFENPSYSYSDGIFLYCMIRHAKPKRIIEIGSGYSSCVTLDTNELYFDQNIDVTFIEPFPELLLGLLKEDDKKRTKLIQSDLQDVDIEVFSALEANDILFIDSTHVSKVYSDVNRIFFEILPRLAAGVFIHFHDIFFPFEYPKVWIRENRAWNELYLLRAFLQYNSAFRITLFNTYLETVYRDYFELNMPWCLKNPGGSIWIQKCT
jgi:predicted O-methyltransferase YrrM